MHRTNFSSSRRFKKEGITDIATSFCFSSIFKQSILDKYDLNRGFYLNPNFTQMEEIGISYKELYQEASYILNEDFTMKIFNHFEPTGDFQLSLGKNIAPDLINGKTFIFNIEMIPTATFGTCYTMTTDFPMTGIKFLYITFEMVNPLKDKPKNLAVYITSKNNSHGINTDTWGDLEPLETQVPFKTDVDKEITHIDLKAYSFKYICAEEASYTSYFECFAEFFSKENFTKCGGICLPYATR